MSEQTRMSSGRETADGTTNKQTARSEVRGITTGLNFRVNVTSQQPECQSWHGMHTSLDVYLYHAQRLRSVVVWEGRFILSLATLLLPRSEPADTVLYA